MMFEIAPTSLWLEDYSAVKSCSTLGAQRASRNVRAHFADDPARVRDLRRPHAGRQSQSSHVVAVRGRQPPHLAANLDRVFRDEMLANLRGTRAAMGRPRRIRQQRRQLLLKGPAIDIQVKGAICRVTSRLGARLAGGQRRQRARKRAPLLALSAKLIRAGFSTIRRSRFGSRTSASIKYFSTRRAIAESSTFASSPTFTRNSSSAA